jgi:hypothetical protein
MFLLMGFAVVALGFVARAVMTRKTVFCVCVCGCLTAVFRLAWLCGQIVGYGGGLPMPAVAMYLLSRFAYLFLTAAMCLLLLHWISAVHNTFFPASSKWVILTLNVVIFSALGISSVYWIVMGVLNTSGVTDASQLLASTFELVVALALLAYSLITLYFTRKENGNVRRNAILMVVTMCLIVASFVVRITMSNVNWWGSGTSNITTERDRISFALVYFVPESLTLFLVFVVGFFTFRVASLKGERNSAVRLNTIDESAVGASRYDNF